MDELYIKMNDCPEIQEVKPYKVAIYCKLRYGILRIGDDVMFVDGENTIWLPTQSQLQNMIIEYWWGNGKPGNWLSVLLQKFNWWLNDTLPESTSMEQLWIAFYMHEHNKIWVGDKWVKEEK